ncbi:MAG: RDD family protein [Nocardiopsaceae bacterium]|nr:RDD family protein [Nocardiopsaceae bacterium]
MPRYPACAARTLAARNFGPVSLTFRGCYARPEAPPEPIGAGRNGYRSTVPEKTRPEKTSAVPDAPGYPGQRFGLPEAGPRSVAPMGRRLLALIIDWVACELIVSAILRYPLTAGASDPRYFATQFWTLAAFGLQAWLITAISGLTLGKRLLGIRVIRTDGDRPGLGWLLVRAVLLLCVVPPLLSDRDLRGLHDRAANTVVVRLS